MPRIFVFVLFLAVASCSSRAAAQTESDQSIRARALFEDGLARADAGDWLGAAQRFQWALEVRATPPIRYNLAHSLSRLGRLVEALAQIESVLGDSAAADEVQDAARRLKGEIEPRLGALIVEVSGDIDGTRVLVDSRPLDHERIGSPIPIDPGMRIARLLRGDREIDRMEADVPAGGSARLHLQSTSAERSSDAPPRSDDTWIWALTIGAIALAIGAGIAIGVAATQTGPQPTMGDFMPSLVEFD